MRIVELFAGLGGALRRKQIETRGHEYFTVDINPEFSSSRTADILDLTPEDIGPCDFIWASDPCESFSVASIGHHWTGGPKGYIPKTEHAIYSMELVKHTVKLIIGVWPKKGFLVENPRGLLRVLPPVCNLPRFTITYCQYGDPRMKPTDLWGHVPGWSPRPICKNGASCHERAPRGARTGTQGINGATDRAIVPWDLWAEILDALEMVYTDNRIKEKYTAKRISDSRECT